MMTKEAMQEIAERISTKISLFKLNEKHYSNKRECHYYSEWKGIECTLNIIGIDFTYLYNDDYEIIAVKLSDSETGIEIEKDVAILQ